MRDYTTNNYCEFLWINDVLELKRNSKNIFTSNLKNNNLSVFNVTVFGTIIEIKQIGSKGFLYHVDDGTGIIACKHGEDQFEEVIQLIENEQYDILNQTLQFRNNLDQSTITENSIEDSIFNDRSIQSDEVDSNKKSQLMSLKSMWDDIYTSFTTLLGQYNIGDVVLIEGKLYDYFNVNQLYVNNIRLIDVEEEIIKISAKLENACDPLWKVNKLETEKRLSGLMTFDHIHHLNAKFPPSRNIGTLNQNAYSLLEKKTEVMKRTETPHLESTITFDTFTNKK